MDEDFCRKKTLLKLLGGGSLETPASSVQLAGFALLSGNELDELETGQLFLTEVNANKTQFVKNPFRLRDE